MPARERVTSSGTLVLTVMPSRPHTTVGRGLPVAWQERASHVPRSHVRFPGQSLAASSGISGKDVGMWQWERLETEPGSNTVKTELISTG